ncbi:DAK2 domain-containing protein [Hygrophoropsis aurantiaca]|uniref:DAK2 domain-containing protein n=1 Tax=Hygrophoropsis aurantiaca TaxID=72124 RepID=A0ACB8A7Y6_9AGAM|nr:DAK2 domain-containing protein [Hygrophoropsis aurantiaca]
MATPPPVVFAIFFTAWSRALRSPSPESASSLSAALKALGAHTPARPGDRTVVDALAPLCAALDASSSTPLARLEAAARAARAGAESTRGMGARLGRASYVAGESGDGVEGDNTGLEGVPPDPGAWGVAVMMEGWWWWWWWWWWEVSRRCKRCQGVVRGVKALFGASPSSGRKQDFVGKVQQSAARPELAIRKP